MPKRLVEFRNDDELRRLRRVDPVPAAVVLGAEESSAAIEGLQLILNTLRRRHWWRRKVFFFPVVITVAVATSAATYTLTRPVSRLSVVGCYEATSTSSPLHVALIHNTPIATCTGLWNSGKMGPRHSGHLIECVESSGAPAVFPGAYPDVCSALGLRVPAGALTASAKKVEDLTVRLSHDFTTSRCLSESQGRVDALNAIGVLEMRDWKVTSPARFSRPRPCASFSIQQSKHIIELRPTPEGQSSTTSNSMSSPN